MLQREMKPLVFENALKKKQTFVFFCFFLTNALEGTKDTVDILSEVGEMACESFTINTAAGRGLYTGRLEQPEKMQPERAGWPCSPDQNSKTTPTVKTKTFLKKGTKIFHLFLSGSLFLGKPVCECVTGAVEAAKNSQFLPASRNVFYTVECIKINYAEPAVEP